MPRFVTITEEHRRSPLPSVEFDGRKYRLSEVLGRVQKIDVGKRVYLVAVQNGAGHIIQVESQQQMAARLHLEAEAASQASEATRRRERPIVVKRDGEPQDWFRSEDEAFEWFSQHYGRSTAYAVKYDGYTVEDVDEPGVNLWADRANGYRVP